MYRSLKLLDELVAKAEIISRLVTWFVLASCFTKHLLSPRVLASEPKG